MTARRRLAVAALALTTAVVGVVHTPAALEAHGVLRRSAPAADARLDAAPREVRLTFNERVALAVASVRLVGPDGATVALSPLRHGDSASVVVADVVAPLVAGAYTVEWQVTGRDGHPVRGAFGFRIAAGAVGVAPPAASAADPPGTATARGDTARGDTARTAAPATRTTPAFDVGSPLYVVVRGLGFVATLALVGVVGGGLLVLPAAAARDGVLAAMRPAHAGRRGLDAALRRAGIAAGVALLAVAALRLAAQVAATGAPVAAVLGATLWGTAWLLSAVAAAVGVLGFAIVARHRAAGWALAGGAAIATAFAAALSGHAAAVATRPAVAVALDAAHVLFAGGWLGTLLVVVAVGLPAARRAEPPVRGRTARALLDAFTPVALASAAGVALTGVGSAYLHLGALDALVASAWGRTLLWKVAAVALVAAAGAYNWRRARPALDGDGDGRLRRAAGLELALGAVVLAVTAVLVATPTPME